MSKSLRRNSLQVTQHTTPYTDVPALSGQLVRLSKSVYKRGFYNNEMVAGYELSYVKKPITVTSLDVKCRDGVWRTLMVDDPMHWLGMGELAKLALPGTVLVAGLGMGLLLHHLVKRDDITKILVVEIDPEIIEFVSPYLPKDDRIVFRVGNFYHFCTEHYKHFETAIIDLWVLNDSSTRQERQRVSASMSVARALSNEFCKKVLIWGVRGY